MNPSASGPANERRGTNRRSGLDRRAMPRRPERRGASGAWLGVESPAEHIRNAMQLLVAGLESETSLTATEFRSLADSTLARLSLALAALEGDRRR